MVSKASEDFPEPDRPVNTTSLSRGISTSMFLRLCSRAPRMRIARWLAAFCWRRAFRISSMGIPGRGAALDFGYRLPRNVGRTGDEFQCRVAAINGIDSRLYRWRQEAVA